MVKKSKDKERKRLLVFRSNKNIYAQVINDDENICIAGASSLSPEIRKKKFASPLERSKEVGKLIASRAKSKNVGKVYFDRNKYKFHGNVKALAEGAKEEGLVF